MNDAHAAAPREMWTSGESYNAYVGRWSRLVARQFLEWLDVPPAQTWLDVGCGTGSVTGTILANHDPERIVSFDKSPAFLQAAEAVTSDARVSFVPGDAQVLPFDDDTFDAAVSGLVLNFIPEPAQMVGGMARVVRPGGTVGLYVWDYAGTMEMMQHFWDAAVAQDPAAATKDEGRRFTIANHDALRRLFSETGLTQIDTRSIDIPTVFSSFDDYWNPFLLGQGTAPTYVQSLSDAARDDLRDAVRERLPIASDGTISLVARALAIKARVG